MSRIHLKEFKSTYGLELLPVSLETFKIGYKVEWDNLFHTTFEVEQTFFTNFLELEDNREASFENLLYRLNLVPATAASFMALDLNKANHIKSALHIPQLGIDLSNKIDHRKILQLSYENVTAKSMVDMPEIPVRSDIINAIQSIQKFERWSRKIRHITFFEQLFYAKNISMFIETSYLTEVKVELERLSIDFNTSVSGNNTTKVSFSNSLNCPFAAKFETVQDMVE